MRAIPASLHAPHSVPWSHNRPPPEPRHDEHEREVHAGLARGHCTAHGDCSRSRGRRIAHLRLVQVVPYLFLPPGKVTNSTRARAASRSWLLVSVVRSECSWPLRRPDPVGSMLAFRTPRGRRSGRPSAQQARATHWATAQPRALAASDFWQGALRVLCTPRPLGCAPRQSRIAPPCPADASVSALTARGMGRASLLCAGGQGTLPASGKASCARCARRDRSGAPRGQATLLR